MMSDLKYFIFFSVFLIGVPVGSYLSLKNQKFEKLIFFLSIFFTCRTAETINFVSHEMYRGSARGFEIALVDLAMLIILFLVIKRRKSEGIKMFPSGAFLFFIYFLFSFFSLFNAGNVLFSSFELWKMIRMYLYFWVFYNYINSSEKIDLFIKYVSYIIFYVFFTVFYQKYGQGIYQPKGPFPHQNSLVMYMIIFTSITFSALLNSVKKGDLLRLGTASAMGGVVIVATLSRAGLACFAISCVVVWGLSIVNKLSLRKIGISFLILFGCIGILYKAMDSIMTRIATAPEESTHTRVVLAKAAVRMANDKMFGVGLNNFGLKINAPYKYGDHIKGWGKEGSKGGLVETVYLMIAAETGWANLAVFILFLLKFYFKNMMNYFKLKNSEYRYLALGLIGGLLGIYLESSLEWVLKQTSNFYQLMMIFALIAAMTELRKKNQI